MTLCSNYGKCIKVHIPKEYPNYRIISMANRSILMVMSPHRDIIENMPEFIKDKPGIYLLYGEEENGVMRIYIGEADGLKSRFNTHHHDPTKEFWENTVIFTTTDNSLTKTGIQYIEAKLIKRSKETLQALYKYEDDDEEFKHEKIQGKIKSENRKDQNLPTTAEFENEPYDEFYDLLLELLNIMGLPFFEPLSESDKDGNEISMSSTDERTIFKFKVGKNNPIDARMTLQSDKYVVLAGSTIRIKWNDDEDKNSGNHRVEAIRNELLDNSGKKREDIAKLIPDTANPEYASLTKDISFKSPSAAGSFVNCRTSAGWTDWVLESDSKITLSDYIGRNRVSQKNDLNPGDWKERRDE